MQIVAWPYIDVSNEGYKMPSNNLRNNELEFTPTFGDSTPS